MDTTERPDGPYLEWTVVPSGIGPLLLAATPQGLVKVGFHAGSEDRVRATVDAVAARLGARARRPEPGAEVLLAEPVRRLAGYFAGSLRRFDLPLDWRLCTGFNREVLQELDRSVPYGSVVGYGELAARVGRPGGAQAVGHAMGSNPLPLVVACHRVVENDGGIGGFGGGVETKRALLALEGVLPQPLF
ncbi:Methylated-DNA--protein-cysteine methyltransferase [Streptomyces sp. enrichment culture]|uniref:Methylated-DNA--protein-cysteine methyltransferase n=1 Tax=Streptomyces toxytricini TaxID=67369 RepID=A0ABW8EPI6_STRT5|nr:MULTISPECIES: methylated-DNA--[protein]-cysteine S-methyltransferase [Streptomyces]MBD3579752.1 methylated-DNA--[protein]-cysteine S-methyltransferase [Streptomyces sp. KD18]GGS95402.1 methylated-DNA--protein-cysteine methyltransferase [Streptomyces toxytricini]